jgi:hypothetical protein
LLPKRQAADSAPPELWAGRFCWPALTITSGFTMWTTRVFDSLSQRHRAGLLTVALALTLAPALSAAQVSESGAGVATLQQRASAFLDAVRRTDGDSIATFFPRTGDWTYVHTAHYRDRDQISVRRFPGSESYAAIRLRGPVWASFEIQFESQPIGLFAHQVMHRGTAWRRVRGNRFVPPGASASSAIFVEWRREGDRWVISALGDESFPSGKTPPWCC